MGKGCILILEEDDELCLTLTHIFERLSFSIHLVREFDRFFPALDEGSDFNFVVADFDQRDPHFVQLASQIIRLKIPAIPIFVISGNDQISRNTRILEELAGISVFNKPFDFSVLLTGLKKIGISSE